MDGEWSRTKGGKRLSLQHKTSHFIISHKAGHSTKSNVPSNTKKKMAAKGFLEYTSPSQTEKEPAEDAAHSPSAHVGVKRKKSKKRPSLGQSSESDLVTTSGASSGTFDAEDGSGSGSGSGGGGHEGKFLNRVVDKLKSETKSISNLATSAAASFASSTPLIGGSSGSSSSGGSGADHGPSSGVFGDGGGGEKGMTGSGSSSSSKKKHSKHHHSGSGGSKTVLPPLMANALHPDTSTFMDLILDPNQTFASSLLLSINAQTIERVNEQRAIIWQFIPFLSHFGVIEALIDRLLSIRATTADDQQQQQQQQQQNSATSSSTTNTTPTSSTSSSQPFQKLLNPTSIECVIINCFLRRADPRYWNSIYGLVQRIVEQKEPEIDMISSPRAAALSLEPSDFDESVGSLVRSFLTILHDTMDQLTGFSFSLTLSLMIHD